MDEPPCRAEGISWALSRHPPRCLVDSPVQTSKLEPPEVGHGEPHESVTQAPEDKQRKGLKEGEHPHRQFLEASVLPLSLPAPVSSSGSGVHCSSQKQEDVTWMTLAQTWKYHLHSIRAVSMED